jgi:hypothetical protein
MLHRSAASCRRTTMRCTRRRSLWACEVPQPPQLSPNPLGGHLLGTKTRQNVSPVAATSSARYSRWRRVLCEGAVMAGAVRGTRQVEGPSRTSHVACCTSRVAGCTFRVARCMLHYGSRAPDDTPQVERRIRDGARARAHRPVFRPPSHARSECDPYSGYSGGSTGCGTPGAARSAPPASAPCIAPRGVAARASNRHQREFVWPEHLLA